MACVHESELFKGPERCLCIPFALDGEEGEERMAGFFRVLDLEESTGRAGTGMAFCSFPVPDGSDFRLFL